MWLPAVRVRSTKGPVPTGLALKVDVARLASLPRMCRGMMCMFCHAHRKGTNGRDSSISIVKSSLTRNALIRSKPVRLRTGVFGLTIAW